MRIAMVGTGYVGLISGLCFAEFGFNVICLDKDENRIRSLANEKMPIYEPGLESLFQKHYKETKKFQLSNDLKTAVAESDVVFITVGTPTHRIYDEADLTAIYSIAAEISENIKKYCVIVTKSTVPVGTSRKIKKIINKKIPSDMFDIVSNPEFLREGSAINDFLRPDRVVIGVDSKKSEQVMESIYKPLSLIEIPIVKTNIETAEVIKYASNSFLATKIAFINEVANLCEKTGANIQDVSKAMGLDKRIGSQFLHASPGFGGSCFPKDIKVFSSTGRKYNTPLLIIDAVNNSNQQRPKLMANKIIQYFSNQINGLKFALLGLSFKPNTDDIRESTSIIIGNLLIEAGAKINAYDPQAMENAKKNMLNFNFAHNVKEACYDVDAIIIATEWSDFRALNLKDIKKIVKKTIIFDFRNIYDPIYVKKAGWEYIGIGR